VGKWKSALPNMLLALLLTAACLGLFGSLGIICPLRFFTGMACPCCGMTRAWLRLLRGDPTGALRFHPLFWLPVPAALVFFGRIIPERLRKGLLWGMLGLLLAVYLLRILRGDPVTAFHPEQGLPGRWFKG